MTSKMHRDTNLIYVGCRKSYCLSKIKIFLVIKWLICMRKSSKYKSMLELWSQIYKYTISTENWIKDLLSMAPPIRTRSSFPQSVFPTRKLPQASYHLSLDGQNENQNHRRLIKLITWTTALSNPMKLWAMSYRTTKDGWVMVESFDKMWSTGEGNGKPFSILALRTSWIVWKGKKIGHWKMNSPGW